MTSPLRPPAIRTRTARQAQLDFRAALICTRPTPEEEECAFGLHPFTPTCCVPADRKSSGYAVGSSGRMAARVVTADGEVRT